MAGHLSFFKVDELVQLEKEFKATCYHEPGHAGAALAQHEKSLDAVLIKKHKKLNFIDGGAEVHLNLLPGGTVARVAVAGCMAEAKYNAVQKHKEVQFDRRSLSSVDVGGR